MARIKLWVWVTITGLALLIPVSGAAQTNCNEGAGLLARNQPQGISASDIISKFSAREREFKEGLTHYTYTQEVSLQTLAGPNVDGEFRQVSQISYNQGKRMEYIVFAPQSTLRRVKMAKEDFEDLERSPFVLTPEDLAQYDVNYFGQQKVDMLDTYVFEVAPKKIQKGKRYFQGRIYVEAQDMAIVKSCGKYVPEENPEQKKKKRGPQAQNVEPTMVTYREEFEHRYWFPTYARSDETLHFQYNDEVHLREVIKYTQYKRPDAGGSTVSTAKP